MQPILPPRDSSPSLSSYETGDLIAEKYQLTRKAGEGGMGEVWVAENTSLQVPVAIKLIRGEAKSASSSERLLREARATAQLHHPAIVRVFDFGITERKDPYIVMELLYGESLRDVLEREVRVAPAQAIMTMLPIIDGLAAAHVRGIVHRDLKPDNIFLAREDTGRLQPKVVDFGVAKILRPTKGKAVTRNGILLGSPEYMSPEQARGLDIDARTDVWAMCVALYETLAGYRPFAAATCQELLRAVIQDDPTPLDGRHEVDADLWAILAKGMDKDRDRRWSSMRELGQALAQWLWDRGVTEDVCASSLRASWLEDADAQARRQSPALGIRVPSPIALAPTAAETPADEPPASGKSVSPPRPHTLDGAATIAAETASPRLWERARARRTVAGLAMAATLSVGWLLLGAASPTGAAAATSGSHATNASLVAVATATPVPAPTQASDLGLPSQSAVTIASAPADDAEALPSPPSPARVERRGTARGNAASVTAPRAAHPAAATPSAARPARPRSGIDFGF